MRIVVPYTRLRDETVEAVRAFSHSHPIHYVYVGDHDEQLFEIWQWIWDAQEDTVVVEHDIVIGPDTITGFEACPELWCAHSYRYSIFGDYAGTGCVRFRGELMEKTPDLWHRVGLHSGPHHPPRHWCSLDGYAQLELSAYGHRQCKHEPSVTHLDESNSHGCVATV